MVDNNDDIESEDDDDSAGAAEGEAEASPEDVDADSSSPHVDHPHAATDSHGSTPLSGIDQSSSGQRGTGGGGSEVSADVPLILAAEGSGSDVGGSGDAGRGSTGGGGSAIAVSAAAENVSDGSSVAGNRAQHECGVYSNDGGGVAVEGEEEGAAAGGGGGGEGGGASGDNVSNPWAGIEWGQGEGESGVPVRRWGRAVQEVDGYGSNGTIASVGELEPPSVTEDVASGGRGNDESRRSSTSLDREGSRVDETGEGGNQSATAAAAAAATTAVTRAKSVAGEPPPRSGSRNKKERRRASGSRAPKASSFSGKSLASHSFGGAQM